MQGLEELLSGRVGAGIYRWEIEPEELFRTEKKEARKGLGRTPEGRLALPLAMGGGHDSVEMPPWLRAAEDDGWEVFGLGPAADEREFLENAAEVFEFPDWTGDGWDEFFDALTDMEWLPTSKGYLVVFAGWRELAAADAAVFETVLGLFQDVTDAWAESETPMVVLFPGRDDELKELERLP